MATVNPNATQVREASLSIRAGGDSQKLALVAGVSSPSAAITAPTAVVYSTVDCFARSAPAPGIPVALVTGVDQFIPANTPLRVDGFAVGDKLAFISAASGSVYITPGA